MQKPSDLQCIFLAPLHGKVSNVRTFAKFIHVNYDNNTLGPLVHIVSSNSSHLALKSYLSTLLKAYPITCSMRFSRLEVIASRLEAIASRLEAISTRFEAIASVNSPFKVQR